MENVCSPIALHSKLIESMKLFAIEGIELAQAQGHDERESSLLACKWARASGNLRTDWEDLETGVWQKNAPPELWARVPILYIVAHWQAC
jgi:hypothetical protein